MESALLRFEVQFSFVKTLEYFLNLLLVILEGSAGIDQCVIQVENNIVVEDVSKHVVYKLLFGCWGISQFKKHNQIFVEFITYSERRFLFFSFFYFY